MFDSRYKDNYITGLSVLWVDNKRGVGILIDNSENECYIDSSILGFEQLKRGDKISGVVGKLSGVLCCYRLSTKYNSTDLIKN